MLSNRFPCTLAIQPTLFFGQYMFTYPFSILIFLVIVLPARSNSYQYAWSESSASTLSPMAEHVIQAVQIRASLFLRQMKSSEVWTHINYNYL